MAKESPNGSKPAEPAPDLDEADGTPFERFERLTRHLVTVPKDAVDREREHKTPARA